MTNPLIPRLMYKLRSRIRFARYNQAIKNQTLSPFQHSPHPVTLGPEQLSRFFTYVANSERSVH